LGSAPKQPLRVRSRIPYGWAKATTALLGKFARFEAIIYHQAVSVAGRETYFNSNPIAFNVATSLSRPDIAAILPMRPRTRFVQVSITIP
jgi:hypothetical protein